MSLALFGPEDADSAPAGAPRKGSNRSRKARGLATQSLVARWYAERLWPDADSAGAGRRGSDVTHVPVIIEVKGRRDFSPLAWVRQMRANPAGEFGPGWVVMRCDGQGSRSVGDFLVVQRLEDHTKYMQELDALRAVVREFRAQQRETLLRAESASGEGDDAR